MLTILVAVILLVGILAMRHLYRWGERGAAPGEEPADVPAMPRDTEPR